MLTKFLSEKELRRAGFEWRTGILNLFFKLTVNSTQNLTLYQFKMKRKNSVDDSAAKGSNQTPRKKRSIPIATADAEREKESPDVTLLLEATMLSILKSRKPGATC